MSFAAHKACFCTVLRSRLAAASRVRLSNAARNAASRCAVHPHAARTVAFLVR